MILSEADRLADQAVADLNEGRALAAESVLAEIVNRFPAVERFHYRLGLARSALDNRESALWHMRRAIELYPDFVLFHLSYVQELAKSALPADVVQAYAGFGGLSVQKREVQVSAAVALVRAGADLGKVLMADTCFLGPSVQAVDLTAADLDEWTTRVSWTGSGLAIEASEGFGRNPLATERLLAFAGYLERMAQILGGEAPHVVLLCVGDVPPIDGRRVLCFSGCTEQHILIPDSSFIGSDGYAHLRELAASNDQPWQNRAPLAYWRGSLTGLAASLEQVLELPRVRLCSLAHPILDARLTGLHQFAHLEPDLSHELANRGVLGEREPEANNFKYKYMIDVDGNTNSWPGFYLKLLVGSPVIKPMSAWRQWYYDRLVDGRNFVAVQSTDEIVEALARLLLNTGEARRIGEAGKQIALSMTVSSEFESFRLGWNRAASPMK